MIVYDVPKMVCYADADTFVNAVNPIRGTNGIRPLGARRYYHARWIAFTDKSKFPNEPKHTIDVGTYASDVCVRFYPNNRITFFVGRWPLNTRQLVGAMFKNRFKVRYASRHKWYLYDLSFHLPHHFHPHDQYPHHYQVRLKIHLFVPVLSGEIGHQNNVSVDAACVDAAGLERTAVVAASAG